MSAAERRPQLKHAPPRGTEPEASDAELWAGVRRGDGRLAAALYGRLRPVVERSLYRALGHRSADGDDHTQLTFERIVRTLVDGTYDGSTPLRAWASLLATRVGFDALRKRYREQALFSPEAEGIDQGPEDKLQARSELERVRRALVTLTPERAETVFMHDALGYELSEIATQLGVSVAAAQSRLVRGRKQLLERLRAEKQG
ncbi:MAG: RNA polymerase sigma factor [Polyangiaceae bacterium]|nr:RNA polymerase sigma factor [Polyangiaceae bacterium]